MSAKRHSFFRSLCEKCRNKNQEAANMSNFVIIPDTACDLNAELRERFSIPDYLRGQLYFPDGHCESSDLDWTNMTPEFYYDSMKGRNVLYKTSTPVIGETVATFEKYLAEGKDVLSISLSSGLSSSYSECEGVASELREKYPDRKIICIDSKRYSTSLALLVIKACMKRDEGMSIEEVAAYIENERDYIHQMGPMDDLFFLVKTGRVSNFKAFFGSMIGLNVVADFNDKGLSEPIGKFKGKATALNATVKYMEKTITNPEEQVIFVAHTNREQAALKLAEMIREKFNSKEIIIQPVGMACGASIGPGLCAAFYKGTKISEGLKAERAIMDEIAAGMKA